MAPTRVGDRPVDVAVTPAVAIGVESVRTIYCRPPPVRACPNAVEFSVDGDPAPAAEGSERQSAKRNQG